jgi:hypothetical protein
LPRFAHAALCTSYPLLTPDAVRPIENVKFNLARVPCAAVWYAQYRVYCICGVTAEACLQRNALNLLGAAQVNGLGVACDYS